MDLNSLSLRELKDLQSRVNRAVASYEDRRKKEALAELEEKAREMGFSLAELTAMTPSKGRAPAKPKYANPANPADTWSGRGRQPRWFASALAAGQTADSMMI
jgi:DNA-binding protein H-NS